MVPCGYETMCHQQSKKVDSRPVWQSTCINTSHSVKWGSGVLQASDISGIIALEALHRVLKRSHTRLSARLALDPLDQIWAAADGQSPSLVSESRVSFRSLRQVCLCSGCVWPYDDCLSDLMEYLATASRYGRAPYSCQDHASHGPSL